MSGDQRIEGVEQKATPHFCETLRCGIMAYLDSADAQIAQNEAHKHDPSRRHAKCEAKRNVYANLCRIVGTRHVLEKRGAKERDGTF